MGLLACVLAARFSGAADPLEAGLVDAGPVVRWSLPLVRVVNDVAAALTVGALLLGSMVIPGATKRASADPAEPRRAAAFQLAMVAAFIWAVAGVVGVIFWFADAAGIRLGDPTFDQTFVSTVWSIEPLRVGLISAMAAAVVASAAALARSRLVGVLLLVVAIFGVVVLGLSGHAGGSADHETAVNALAAHLLGATVWVGGLLALVVLSPRLGRSLPVVARRYSAVAIWCYVTIGVSGVMSATTRLGSWSDLTTPYGVLILIKVGAFILLGLAGWWHRRRTIAELDARSHRRPFLRLAVGETLLMGLTFGVATALARTAPPVPESSPSPTAVLALTGFPAPGAPTAMSWLTTWRVEWLFLATALLAIGVYVAGVVRLHRRGVHWPVLRTIQWVLGWLVFIWATNGFLGVYGRVAFSWHMTLHMVEAMVIPILLVLGAPMTLALRTLKPRKDGTIGPRELLLIGLHSRVTRVMASPIFAGAFFFMSLVIFYWTGLFELALATHTGHLLMTAHFMLAGYLFAWSLIGIDPGPKKWSPVLRLVTLFATISFHAFFGVSMIGGDTLLAPTFFQALNLPWMHDLLADQRTGGSIAWAIGELPSLALAIVVAAQWARSDRSETRRSDRAADRDGDAELKAYNERLGRMAGHEQHTQP